MDRTHVHEGVRQMRFEGLLDRHERGELSQMEAAEMLGISERSFRRWRDRLREDGPSGLSDPRLGKPSGRRARVAGVAATPAPHKGSRADFTAKHLREDL